MTTLVLRQKLTDYLRVADDKKIKAIYTMVEEDINNFLVNDWDEDFVKELDKRSAEFKTGKAKTHTWEKTKAAAVKKVKSKNK